MGDMYYNPPVIDLPVKKDSYAIYVNSLRARFTIRIEVNNIVNKGVGTLKIEHLAIRDKLEQYLLSNVDKGNYHMQQDAGYHGLFYTWFMDKEDALAFALTFGGKAV